MAVTMPPAAEIAVATAPTMPWSGAVCNRMVIEYDEGVAAIGSTFLPRAGYRQVRGVTPATIMHSLDKSATMHSVSESATSLREQKRWETSQRISRRALELTDQRGLDGFTMDELAEAAEVSRRTLFNYFPSKLDAVLGEHPEVTPTVLATFHAGGPHGQLVDDLAELARAALSVKQTDRSVIELARRVMADNPRLLAAAHERFEAMTEEFTASVVEREGTGFDLSQARLLLRLLLALLDSALAELLREGESRALVEIFDSQLRHAHQLFA